MRQTIHVNPTARPVIGISTYLEDVNYAVWNWRVAMLPAWYPDSIARAGGRPVLLPPDDDASVMERLDGLVLIGGADIDATLYGEVSHETADAPRTSRDASELALYRKARELHKPVLGICRGFQMMVVAHGGKLTQHLPEVTDERHRPELGKYDSHPVKFAEGSLISKVCGVREARVNTYHHQGVADPGDLTVTGWADDGLVEVCEDPSDEFVLGVQWHPEAPFTNELSDSIFGAFVAACRK